MADWSWKSIRRYLKLLYLRHKARGLVRSVYAEFGSCGGDGGNRMKLVLRPQIAELALRADAVLDEIAKLDPENAPESRLYPMIKGMM